jgi:uncharacterized protein
MSTPGSSLLRSIVGGMSRDGLGVSDNPDAHRYEATIDDEVVGYIAYHLEDGLITLVHTEVDEAVEGQGVGSRLVAATLDDIRSRKLSVEPICPFVRGYLERHPEHADLIASR